MCVQAGDSKVSAGFAGNGHLFERGILEFNGKSSKKLQGMLLHMSEDLIDLHKQVKRSWILTHCLWQGEQLPHRTCTCLTYHSMAERNGEGEQREGKVTH